MRRCAHPYRAATRSFCSSDNLQRRSLVPLLNSLRFTRAQSAAPGKLRRVSTIRYTLHPQQYMPRALWLNSEVPSPAQSPRQALRAAVRVMGRVAYAAVRALLSVHFQCAECNTEQAHLRNNSGSGRARRHLPTAHSVAQWLFARPRKSDLTNTPQPHMPSHAPTCPVLIRAQSMCAADCHRFGPPASLRIG